MDNLCRRLYWNWVCFRKKSDGQIMDLYQVKIYDVDILVKGYSNNV